MFRLAVLDDSVLFAQVDLLAHLKVKIFLRYLMLETKPSSLLSFGANEFRAINLFNANRGLPLTGHLVFEGG